MGNVRKCEVVLKHIRGLRAYKDFDDGECEKVRSFFEPYKGFEGI